MPSVQEIIQQVVSHILSSKRSTKLTRGQIPSYQHIRRLKLGKSEILSPKDEAALLLAEQKRIRRKAKQLADKGASDPRNYCVDVTMEP